MPRNIEIKAKVESLAVLEPRVAALADNGPVLVEQDDAFFTCPNGRLKLRELSPTQGELIFYRRPDQAGPKESYYVVTRTREPANLRETLTQAYGQAGRVRKRRVVYLVGKTRVHLDSVENLGEFVEFEVVLGDSEPASEGEKTANELLASLGIPAANLIEGAYRDLLNKKGTQCL